MIPILVRVFGFLLLMAFIAWTLYVFWLGLKSFFVPKAKKRTRATTVSLPPAGTTPAP